MDGWETLTLVAIYSILVILSYLFGKSDGYKTGYGIGYNHGYADGKEDSV